MGRGHLVVGIGGASKTRFLYHLGAGAVTGQLPWGWAVDSTGSAALFLAEDVAGDVHHAVHALAATLSPAQRDMLGSRLRIFPLAGRNPLLLALDGQALRLTAAYDWLMEQIDRLPGPVAFVGLDPVLALTEGDELNPAHQRRAGELVDQIGIASGACAVATAHAAKSIQQVDELGSHSARGSGAITDAVRGEFTLRAMTADEARRFGITDMAERKHFVQLAATKGNHLPPDAFAPVWLRRGAGGVLEGVTLEQVEAGAVGSRETAALEVLRAAAGIDGVPTRRWRDLCVHAGLIAATAAPEAQDKAIQRMRAALQAAGLVAPGRTRGTWVGA